MYRALYRKWRPQTFGQLVGQEPIVKALTGQLSTGRVGHAYLFTGTRGTGKTSCAKILAKAVNCLAPEGAEPCGICESCVGIENGSMLDVTEIDAASNNGVDDVRDLRDETAYRPSFCAYKVYIIDEVHMLSGAAFNALLKIMEEPPSHVIFILATTEIHKVPATILSRCQRFDFARIDASLISGRLMDIAKAEDIRLAPGAADLIARVADGALRDALSLLDTCAAGGQTVDEELVRSLAGIADKNYLFRVSGAVSAADTTEILKILAGLRGQSLDAKRLTEELIFHFRNLLLALAAPDGSLLDGVMPEERESYLEARDNWSEAAVVNAIRRLSAALDKMGRAQDPRVELELALLDLAGLAPEPAVQNAAKIQQKPEAKPEKKPKTNPLETSEKVEPPFPDAPQKLEKTFENTEETPSQVQASPLPPPEPALSESSGEARPFAEWPKVIEQMAAVDRLLHSYMKTSNAYFDGNRMLIDGGDMFLTFMRENEGAAQTIKSVIQQATGLKCGIGPYSKEMKQREAKSAQDLLREMEAQGVPVEYT